MISTKRGFRQPWMRQLRPMPGGVVVLSGILRHHAARVLAAYGAQRLFLLRRTILGDWVTLVLSP